jgi:hypothetical protein
MRFPHVGGETSVRKTPARLQTKKLLNTHPSWTVSGRRSLMISGAVIDSAERFMQLIMRPPKSIQTGIDRKRLNIGSPLVFLVLFSTLPQAFRGITQGNRLATNAREIWMQFRNVKRNLIGASAMRSRKSETLDDQKTVLSWEPMKLPQLHWSHCSLLL